MPEFAQGLKLKVTDRDEFNQFINNHAHDPGIQSENWGAHSIPDAIYIANYTNDTPSFYKTYDHHVNDTLTWNYWNEPLLKKMLNEGILNHTGKYNTELIESQNNSQTP